jgi:hypothetical protein
MRVQEFQRAITKPGNIRLDVLTDLSIVVSNCCVVQPLIALFEDQFDLWLWFREQAITVVTVAPWAQHKVELMTMEQMDCGAFGASVSLVGNEENEKSLAMWII